MSRIKSRDTRPELILKSRLKGYIYQPQTFGNPDFISYKKKEVIFVDGCFWHKCPIHYKEPKSNKKYWLPKIKKNCLRDREISMAYINSGWKISRVWEHDLNKSEFKKGKQLKIKIN